MEKNIGKLTVAAAGLAGAGAAVVLAKKASQAKKVSEANPSPKNSGYRNTELGRHEKNSKGIYYSNGNYEAFARPEKPEGVDEKNAYIVGSGLASLAAACFLVRDGQMPGSHIHILEAMDIAGGACDGIFDPLRGYVMRGGREMENHFECLWDLFRSIPSLEKPGASVLDEFYWLNRGHGVIQSGQHHIVADQRTVPDENAALVLKFAAHVDKDMLSQVDVLSTVSIKGRKQPKSVIYRLTDELRKKGPQLLRRMITAIDLRCNFQSLLTDAVHKQMGLAAPLYRLSAAQMFQKRV